MLNASQRPRQTFNEEGVCGACEWNDLKKTKVDWKKRWEELELICEKYKKRNKEKCNCPV